jgi:hypothetical protein
MAVPSSILENTALAVTGVGPAWQGARAAFAARSVTNIESNILSRGLSPDGLAYELKYLNRHLEGSSEAMKMLGKGDAAHVFASKEMLGKVEAEIFERGINTGVVRSWDRYGLNFDYAIGHRIAPDGGRIPLSYGELVLRDGPYHVMPRTRPAM